MSVPIPGRTDFIPSGSLGPPSGASGEQTLDTVERGKLATRARRVSFLNSTGGLQLEPSSIGLGAASWSRPSSPRKRAAPPITEIATVRILETGTRTRLRDGDELMDRGRVTPAFASDYGTGSRRRAQSDCGRRDGVSPRFQRRTPARRRCSSPRICKGPPFGDRPAVIRFNLNRDTRACPLRLEPRAPCGTPAGALGPFDRVDAKAIGAAVVDGGADGHLAVSGRPPGSILGSRSGSLLAIAEALRLEREGWRYSLWNVWFRGPGPRLPFPA